MAGDSEKRIKREAAIYTNYYNIALFLVNCIYLLAVLYDWENFGFWTICGIAFFSAVNYVCYRSVISALNNGIETGYFNDLLLVNLFVQVTTCYSSLFWVFYLLIPGYFIYQYGGFIKNMIFGAPQEEVVETEAEKKRREKKERQEGRPKVKYSH